MLPANLLSLTEEQWLLNVVLLRSGMLLEADAIAEQAPAERTLTLAMIFMRAAQKDKTIADVLLQKGIAIKLKQETLERKQKIGNGS